MSSLMTKLIGKARRRSPWLFHLNSGGCNGCDIEFSACLGPRYDIEQAGMLLVGSPRHADVLCVAGPVTRGAEDALQAIYAQMAEPKVVVAIGNCPATCDVYAGSPVISGPLDKLVPVDVFVPGCPPRPHDMMAGVARAVVILAGKRRAGKRRKAEGSGT